MKRSETGENLFQILITDDPDQDLHRIRPLTANRQSFELLYPTYTYTLLGNDEIRTIIREHFGPDVLTVYDALTPYAYKADLARYCVLYVFGGIYADLSMRMLSRMTLPPGKGLFCFRDAYANGGSSWAVSNGLMLAEPGRPELSMAIELIKENHRTLSYGASVLHPTGPALLGRAIAMVDRGEELEVGDFRNLTGTVHPLSYGYVDGSGKLVCIRMKEDGGDLTLLGLRGVNVYDAIWRLRTVYGEPITFDHSDQRLRLFQGDRDGQGIVVTERMSGCVIFGPYVYVTAGQFLGIFRFDEGFQVTRLTLDVVTDEGVVAQTESVRLDTDATAVISFTLPRRCPNLQVRLSVDPGCHGRCTGLEIRRLPGG